MPLPSSEPLPSAIALVATIARAITIAIAVAIAIAALPSSAGGRHHNSAVLFTAMLFDS
jgi:hypothetical protein